MQLPSLTIQPEKTSDLLLSLLIDSLPVFIGYIDSDQKYVLANKLYKEFFGTQFSIVKGLHVRQVIGNEAYESTRPHIEAALRGEHQSYEYELKILGKAHWMKAVYVPDIEHGKVKGMFVLGIDITDQRCLEHKLRSAKEQLEYVIESNPALIWVGKPLPDLSDSYSTFQSKSTLPMVGFESKEFVGEKGSAFWASRVHPEDLAKYREETAGFWAKGHRATEYRFLHKDGNYRWIREETAVIRDSAGNVQDVIGYWIDITERKRMEEELLRSSRLAAIGETAAMVGHDLRNPLQAMMSAVYLAKKMVESCQSETRDECFSLLTGLDEQVHYMDKIVSDLQTYSSTVTADPIEFDLIKLVKDVAANVKKPAKVDIVFDSKDTLQVMADPVLMKRVIVNLVTNSIQAMPDGGKVYVTCSNEGGKLSVVVKDTGMGIAQEDIAHVFTPFFTKKAKGQGLGLAICKRLVEAQGGKITLESKLGHGTTFTVTIPSLKSLEVS